MAFARPSFRNAVRWMVDHEDVSWIYNETPDMAMWATAAPWFIADMFQATPEQIIKETRRQIGARDFENALNISEMLNVPLEEVLKEINKQKVKRN